jgi:phosphatidylinositol glycan class W
VLRVVLHPFIASMPVSLLGLLVALGLRLGHLIPSIHSHIGTAHQIFLSAGLMAYVLNSPRQTLISANKEGLVSLTGMYYLHFPCFA